MSPDYIQHSPFPPHEHALTDPNGLLAYGGDLSTDRLKSAYFHGIFPWFAPTEIPMWWSPDPRAVLFLHDLHISRSMKKWLKKSPYRITLNYDFDRVIEACSLRGEGTWIGSDMKHSYQALHRQGRAHSVEAWLDNTLVGGLYGVNVGALFCGESMFSHRDNASKCAFIAFHHHFLHHGGKLFDCQVLNAHTASLGVVEIPRQQFLAHLMLYRETDLSPCCWERQVLDI